MLESGLFESRPDRDRIGTRRKPATLAMAILVHVLIASVLILIPLLQTQAIPPVALPPPVVSPGLPVRMIKLAGTPSAGRAAPRPLPPALPEPFTLPTSVPDKVPYVIDAIDISSLESFIPGSSDGPGGSRGPANVIGMFPTVAPPAVAPPPRPPDPPTPPPAPKFEIRGPLRVSSSLQVSRLVKKVDPEYPILAHRGHIEGTVVAEARITGSGTIDSVRIISGNPLFYQAVLDAVKQWRYQPTLLNGEPVDVITTITVNFRLSEPTGKCETWERRWLQTGWVLIADRLHVCSGWSQSKHCTAENLTVTKTCSPSIQHKNSHTRFVWFDGISCGRC